MKTLHILLILVIVLVTGIGTYVLLPHMQSAFPISYANLELMVINETYTTNHIVQFQIKAVGYGIPCDMPAITIYKSDQPSVVVFEKKVPPLMCPIEGPTFFNVVYPSKNDTYSVTIKDASKYTIHISFLNNEINKEFVVK
jgi:hypothetical protein